MERKVTNYGIKINFDWVVSTFAKYLESVNNFFVETFEHFFCFLIVFGKAQDVTTAATSAEF